jgi:hypothetical protein
LIDLQPKDILQINATVIAGGLIFLTLIGINPTIESIRSFPVVLTLLTVIMFSMSSWVALQGNKDGALDIMKVGFLIIVIFALLIMITVLTKDIIQYFYNPTNQTITNQNVTNQTIVNQTKIAHLDIVSNHFV